MAKSIPKFLSASGLVWTGHGYLDGLLVGMDNAINRGFGGWSFYRYN